MGGSVRRELKENMEQQFPLLTLSPLSSSSQNTFGAGDASVGNLHAPRLSARLAPLPLTSEGHHRHKKALEKQNKGGQRTQ